MFIFHGVSIIIPFEYNTGFIYCQVPFNLRDARLDLGYKPLIVREKGVFGAEGEGELGFYFWE